MIVGSVDVIIQAARLRDGSRRITHITEVIGMEGDVIITQDLLLYDIMGEDAQGKLIGQHVSTGIGRPPSGTGLATMARKPVWQTRSKAWKSRHGMMLDDRERLSPMFGLDTSVLLFVLLAACAVGGGLCHPLSQHRKRGEGRPRLDRSRRPRPTATVVKANRDRWRKPPSGANPFRIRSTTSRRSRSRATRT
jgi:hypothetical protein